MIAKKKILIVYSYFYPGYRAGGPIQSLANIITASSSLYEYMVITSAYDLNVSTPYSNIDINSWNTIFIKSVPVTIWYADKKISYKQMRQLFIHAAPDIVFINGLYTRYYFFYPLLIRFFHYHHPKYILSPRGMLQSGALAVKPFKKYGYLKLLCWSGLLKNIIWHATTADEAKDIYQRINKNAVVKIAANIPASPVDIMVNATKQQDELHLIYLSVITEKKNLLLLIQTLLMCRSTIYVDIYGPIKEADYWNTCSKAIAQLPKHISIKYQGDIVPQKVQQTILQYDALILLTKGENFGHALFESLSVGRPIITSYFTPWNNLQAKNAGWNVNIQQPKNISNLLDELSAQNNQSWQLYCTSAYQLAKDYCKQSNFIEAYQNLFS